MLISDDRTTIDDIVAAEDKAVVRWSIRGTFIGEPTNGFQAKKGERFAMGLVSMHRFANGKIEERLLRLRSQSRRAAVGVT